MKNMDTISPNRIFHKGTQETTMLMSLLVIVVVTVVGVVVCRCFLFVERTHFSLPGL